jgi:hypothetical protein
LRLHQRFPLRIESAYLCDELPPLGAHAVFFNNLSAFPTDRTLRQAH